MLEKLQVQDTIVTDKKVTKLIHSETRITERSDKGHRRDASQFFIAGELCRRGLVAVVTLGNCPNTDILCSDVAGRRFVHIQVKTFVPGNKTCSVGIKTEMNYGDNFFWILGGIPTPQMKDQTFQYFIIPSPEMSRWILADFKAWVAQPGKKKPHDPENTFRTVTLPPYKSLAGWDISEYRNRWDLIEQKLRIE
jgi:hypothetical protein